MHEHSDEHCSQLSVFIKPVFNVPLLEIMYQCKDCTSAIYGWSSVYSHLMCRIIQQLSQELPEVGTSEH
jgi:hypothetical protein